MSRTISFHGIEGTTDHVGPQKKHRSKRSSVGFVQFDSRDYAQSCLSKSSTMNYEVEVANYLVLNKFTMLIPLLDAGSAQKHKDRKRWLSQQGDFED